MAEEFVIRGILDLTDAEAQLAALRARLAALNAQSAAGSQNAVNASKVLQQQLNLFQQNIGQINNVYMRSLQNSTGALNTKIRQLGFALQRLGVQGAAAGGELIGAFGAAGLALGGVTLAVVALTAGFAVLVKTGVDALTSLATAALDTGQEVQNAQAQFTAFFQGNADAAESVIDRTFRFAAETGVQNAQELSRAFLPLVQNLDQLEQIMAIGAGLQAFQPEQSAFLRQTLQDLLAGQTRSIVQRFELPREVATEFREAFDTEGIAAGLEVIQGFLDDTGRSIENFGDTATFQLNKIKARYEILQAVVGEPFVAALSEELSTIIELIDANEPIIERFGAAFGVALGEGVKTVSDIIQNLIAQFGNIEPVLELTFLLVNQILDQIEMLTGSDFGAPNIGNIINTFINAPLMSLAGGLNLVNLGLRTLEAGAKAALLPLLATVEVLAGRLELADLGEFFETALADLAAPVNEALSSLSQSREEYTQSITDYTVELDKSTQAGEDAANSYLEQRSALEAMDKKLAEVAEAQETLNEAVDDFNVDVARDLEDQALKEERARTDLQEDFADRREDIEQDHRDRLADIGRDFYEDQVKQATEFSRDEEDIARDAGRRLIDLEKDIAQDRAKIELDLQQELDRINRRFDQSRREAIRDNDAVAFVRNEERRNFELNEARIRAQQDVQEADTAAQEKRDALNTQLQREIEDAEIANRRKLEDLITNLNNEIAAETTRWNRALAEQDLYEDRKLESQQESFDREREDMEKAWDRRIEDLNRRYSEELAVLSEFQAREVQLVLDHQRQMAQLFSSGFAGSSGGGFFGNSGAIGQPGGFFGQQKKQQPDNTEELRQRAQRVAVERQRLDLLDFIEEATRQQLLNLLASFNVPIPGQASSGGGGGAAPRQHGGPAFAGRSYLFEGREPEVITFGRHARVTPMRQIPSGAFAGGGSITNNQFEVNQSMLDPSSLSPAQRAIMKQMANEIVAEIVARL